MRVAPAAAVMVAATVLAACGSSQAPPEPSSGTPTIEHGSYAHCLVEHGVPTPPPGPVAPPGVDAQTWAKAQEACANLAPGPAG
jgi:hypothetical protein